jgi:hypothetical protein
LFELQKKRDADVASKPQRQIFITPVRARTAPEQRFGAKKTAS